MKKIPPVARAMLLAGLLGCLQLPFHAFMADDFVLLGMLQGGSPLPGRPPFALYTLADGPPVATGRLLADGSLPWFFDTRFRMRFLRPLSSLLLTADHALFGLHSLGYAAHTLFWFILLASGVARLYRSTLPDRTARLAAALFSLSAIFYAALAWASCRHSLTAPAIAIWAWHAHRRWLKSGRGNALGLAVGGFVAALLAGEAALAMLAYPLAWEMGQTGTPLRRRLAALLPIAALGAVYLAFYGAGGYGAGYGGDYFSPAAQPLAYLMALPGRLLASCAVLLLGGAIDGLVLLPVAATALPIAGALAVLLIALLSRTCRQAGPAEGDGAVARLGVGALLACLPLAAAGPFSFRLVAPFVGAAALIAHLLHRSWRLRTSVHGLRRTALLTGLAWLAFTHLTLAPLLRVAFPPQLKARMSGELAATMANLDRRMPGLEGKRVIVLNVPDIVLGWHAIYFRRLHRLPLPKSWHALAWGASEIRVLREAHDAFRLEWLRGGMDRPALPVNRRLELDGLEIAVLEKEGTRLRAIRCRISGGLDDSTLLLLGWQDGRLQEVRLPAIGEVRLNTGSGG